MLTKGATDSKEQEEIVYHLKNSAEEENTIYCFCGMFNIDFTKDHEGGWKSMSALYKVYERITSAFSLPIGSTPMQVGFDSPEEKGATVADCLCDAIDDCQFEIIVEKCQYRNDDDGFERCQKKLKVNILKKGTRECPVDQWKNDSCSTKECDDHCNQIKSWQMWENCNCNKRTRKRSGTGFTESCREYQEENCSSSECFTSSSEESLSSQREENSSEFSGPMIIVISVAVCVNLLYWYLF